MDTTTERENHMRPDHLSSPFDFHAAAAAADRFGADRGGVTRTPAGECARAQGGAAHVEARRSAYMGHLLQRFRQQWDRRAPGWDQTREAYRLLHCEAGYRIELTTVSWEEEGVIRDYPWLGMHWVIQGQIALCRYSRRPLPCAEGLYALDVRGRVRLDASGSVAFTPLDGGVHEITARSPVARVLSVNLTPEPDAARFGYWPLDGSGCFDETPVVWSVPMETVVPGTPA